MKHKVEVGTIVNGSYEKEEYLNTVAIEGEELAHRTAYDEANSDTRGSRETLFRLDDGRLVVHVFTWSNWQGESSHYEIVPVTEIDLENGGRFEWLGQLAGFGKELSLDEYLIEVASDNAS